MKNVHFLSKTIEWSTPQKLFDVLDREFQFTLDPCASKNNAKCKHYCNKSINGLTYDWSNYSVFMNPPYGRQIKWWMKKAYNEAQTNPLPIVCLIPARTDTIWWHEYCMKADEIRFVRGRLKFSDCENSAPFPSAVVIFYPKLQPRLSGNCTYCISWERPQ